MSKELAPPIARIEPHEVKAPGGTRVDNYYWLRDDKRSNKDVLAHLGAENAYMTAFLAHTKPMQTALYDELIGRIQQDDTSAPVLDRGYWYYSRTITGGEYRIYCRKKGTLDAPEQILLDGNAMAKGHDFFQVGHFEVSANGKLLAYTLDTIGRRQWTLHVRNLETGETLTDEVQNVESDLAWVGDKAVLYVEKDPVTLLSTRVKRHALGTAAKKDTLVYEEKDHAFYLGVEESRSHKLIFITLESTVSSEQWFARTDDPALKFEVIVPRERDHEYGAEDHGDHFVLRTNYQAKNFRVVEVPIAKVRDRHAWKDLIPARDDAFVERALVFDDCVAIDERSGGLAKIRIKPWKKGESTVIAADEASYTAHLEHDTEPSSKKIRYSYTSLATPNTMYDYDIATGKKQLIKREPVRGDFDPARYVTEYLHATASDGTQIPISVVYRKDLPRDGSAALLQKGYGSYGLSYDPHFDSDLLSLLDRGFVYAIAHIRGGQELGRAWYEDGKLLHKKHTFTDFIAATDFLVEKKYCAKDRVFASGGSAGGLLMGVIANLAPEKYRGIVADVPFVDVVTTMLDESIPLTTNEFDEWGNPKEKAAYDYMLSYSPYDNVAKKAYPSMLITTGFWDSQVQYYEPAKWVAKLRAHKTDKNPLLFKINMEAGHGGKSGRFQQEQELALEYAFFFDVLGRDVTKEK